MVFTATKYYKHVVDPTAGRQRHADRKSILKKKSLPRPAVHLCSGMTVILLKLLSDRRIYLQKQSGPTAYDFFFS